MASIQRSYQFRFYPTALQVALLTQYFGAARWVWNASLAWRTHCYRALAAPEAARGAAAWARE